MADDPSGSDGADCGGYVEDDHTRVCRDGISRSEWELVPSTALEPAYSSIVQPCDADQQDIFGADNNEILYMNYFASTSEESIAKDQSMQRSGAAEAVQDRHIDGSPSLAPELDWIEPSAPVRSCALSVTDEDDDSPSRSCSDESREGTQRQSPDTSATAETYFTASGPSGTEMPGSNLMADLQREFLTKDDAAAAFLSRPTVGIEESNIEAVEVEGNDPSASNEHGKDGDSARWRLRFGALLSEQGRANTLWSIGLAAAAIGLIVLGNGWQRFRLQYQKLRVGVSSKGRVMEAIFVGVKPPATLVSLSRGLESFPFSNFLL